MTEMTQTTNTKEIKPMTVEELLGFFQVDLTKIDKTTLSKKIYLVNDKCPCMFVTTGSKVQGEFDDSDIYFKTRESYCDESIDVDKNNSNDCNIKILDLLKYLEVDTKLLIPVVLQKQIYIKFIGNHEPVPVLSIDTTKSNDILLSSKYEYEWKIPNVDINLNDVDEGDNIAVE